MNIKVLAATLAGAVTMFVLGWLIFGLLLANYFNASMVNYTGLVKNPPDFIPLFLFQVAFAWLIAFIFDYWAGIKTLVTGLKGGVLILVPIALGINFQQMAF